MAADEDSVAYYSEELRIAQEIGDIAGEADATWNLAFERVINDDLPGVFELAERAQRLYEQGGDELGSARVAWSLITVAPGDHPNPKNKAALVELLARFERNGDTWYACQTMMSLAWVEIEGGDFPSATRWFVRAFQTSHALRDRTGTTIAIPLAALMAIEAGRPEDAARLMGASEHLCELFGVKAPVGLRELLQEQQPRGDLRGDARQGALRRGVRLRDADDARRGGRACGQHPRGEVGTGLTGGIGCRHA